MEKKNTTIKESLKERLNKNQKIKTSISIDEEIFNKCQEVLKKEYKNASFSRLIEMLLEDFLEFHHQKYINIKEEVKK